MKVWKSLISFIRWRSLKTRITLLTLAIFVVGIWSAAFYSSRAMHKDMQELLSNQQFSTVSILAGEINHEFVDRFSALTAVARDFDPAILGDPAASTKLLEQRPLLQRLFNDGVIAYRLDGTAIAEAPKSSGRVGINYSDRNYLLGPLKEGIPTVGNPHVSISKGYPEFVMAVPIRDDRNTVIGALSGVTSLGKSNFLDRVTQNSVGKAGGYMLVARQERLIVTATDKRLVMYAIPPLSDNSLRNQFFQGHEGAGIAVNPLGVDVLVAAKTIPATNWFIAAALPTTEAFAPIDAVKQRMLLVTSLLTVLIGTLTWLMLNRQLSPLLSTVNALARLSDTNLPSEPLPITEQDEVGELIGGFNRLLEILARREVALSESEERYRSLFKLSPDAMFVHRNNMILFANDATAHVFHADSVAALIGRDWHDLIAPEDWPVTEQRIAFLESGTASYIPPLERRHLMLDGQITTLESAGVRIMIDGKPAVLSVIRDITERKQSENHRLSEARQQRDTLVREVHHRIKNNLQSVAGLLQRELGKFVELDPRLETAISQVHAIATVHGLQSADPDELIYLHDSVRSICESVSGLTQRAVVFRIEHEQSSYKPAQIDSTEAVPLALALNELILNAVKHSPQDGPATTVSLNADDNSACLVIRNAVVTTPQFDITTGAGINTGLRLVRSLLPNHGAKLKFELDTEHFMLARLTLKPPVVVTAPEKEPC